MSQFNRNGRSTEPSFESLVEWFYVTDAKAPKNTGRKKRMRQPEPEGHERRRSSIMSSARARGYRGGAERFKQAKETTKILRGDGHRDGVGRPPDSQGLTPEQMKEGAARARSITRAREGPKNSGEIYLVGKQTRDDLAHIRERAKRTNSEVIRLRRNIPGGTHIYDAYKMHKGKVPLDILKTAFGGDLYIKPVPKSAINPRTGMPSLASIKKANPALSNKKIKDLQQRIDWSAPEQKKILSDEEMFLLHPEDWTEDQHHDYFKSWNDKSNSAAALIFADVIKQKIDPEVETDATISNKALFDNYGGLVNQIIEIAETSPESLFTLISEKKQHIDFLARDHNDAVKSLAKKKIHLDEIDDKSAQVFEGVLQDSEQFGGVLGQGLLAIMYAFDDIPVRDKNANFIAPQSQKLFPTDGRHAKVGLLNEFEKIAKSLAKEHAEIDMSMAKGAMQKVIGYKTRKEDPMSIFYNAGKRIPTNRRTKSGQKKSSSFNKHLGALNIYPLVPMNAKWAIMNGNSLSSMYEMVKGSIGFMKKDKSIVPIGKGTANELILGLDREGGVRAKMILGGYGLRLDETTNIPDWKKRFVATNKAENNVVVEITDSYTGKIRKFVNINPMNKHGTARGLRYDEETGKRLRDDGIFAAKFVEQNSGKHTLFTVDDIFEETGVHPYIGLYQLWSGNKPKPI